MIINSMDKWTLKMLSKSAGICENYIYLIPHSDTGKSLKAFDQKKKKICQRSASIYRSQTWLAKNALIFLQVFLSPRLPLVSGAHRSLVLRIIVVSLTRHEADLWFQEILKTCLLAKK